MKKIYICHEYYEMTHFKALYDRARDYGYQPMDLIVLNPSSAVKRRMDLIQQEGLEAAEHWYQNNFLNIGKLWLLEGEIVIIGVAPYNRLMSQYQSVLSKNKSIYMTSWMDWHSDNVPYPYHENKSGFMKTLMNSIDGVACVSKKTEWEIMSWKLKTQVVNHSIVVDEYWKKENYKRKGKYIFLGQLIERKNIGEIVRYLQKHPEKNIEIDLAGKGALMETLEQYAKIDNRLHILGHLSKAEIKRHLHEYDYLILPSKDELFGIVLLEALACGVPCISSDAMGPMEIICHNKTGIIFSLENLYGFEQAMNYSMELENDQYEAMCKNAILEGRKYDVDEIIKRWVTLFENCNRHR